LHNATGRLTLARMATKPPKSLTLFLTLSVDEKRHLDAQATIRGVTPNNSCAMHWRHSGATPDCVAT
jgi:hypothetical protein